VSKPRLCPGCDVRGPWEHRCTGILLSDSGSMFLRFLPCECPECKEDSAVKEPKIIQVKAIDVVPYLYGVWCTVGGGEPFVNGIDYVSWMEDGKIGFGLDTHNFMDAEPDAMIDVVEIEFEPGSWRAENRERHKKEHAAFVAKRLAPAKLKRKLEIKAQIKALEAELKALEPKEDPFA